jgi:hypothetical protein
MATVLPSSAPDPALAAIPATAGGVAVGSIEQTLRTLVEGLVPESSRPPGRGRPRVLPALALWSAVLVGVLEGGLSQCGLWRRLTELGLWDYPRYAISDQAVYHRLARDGTTVLERLFAQVSAALAARLAPAAQRPLAAFASGVYALDETTLDQVARRLPALRTAAAGSVATLPGKLSALFDVRLQQFVRVVHQANPVQNEKLAARDLVAPLRPGALVLADLGYFGFRWFDDLTDQGLHWVSRLRQKTSTGLVHVWYEQDGVFDGVVWLGAHRADRAKHAVRLVRFRVGAQAYAYLTNVLDPTVLPIGEIARLYARRWDLELAFRLIKQYLGLHLLWSSKVAVVLQQVWAVLLIAQIVQALRLEIAARAEIDPFDVSLPLLVRYAPQYTARGRDPIAAFVQEGRRLGFLRPARRIRLQIPLIPPAALQPYPPDLVLQRTPRYAQKDCRPR